MVVFTTVAYYDFRWGVGTKESGRRKQRGGGGVIGATAWMAKNITR